MAAKESGEDGVGVLGWLGFVIINFAAWGIIVYAQYMYWPLSLGICIVYTAVTMSIAATLSKHDEKKYRQFSNLLWVLGCLFLGICGVILSIRLFSPPPRSSRRSADLYNKYHDPIKYLPEGASDDLRSWAEERNYAKERIPNYASFGGVTFFSGNAVKGTRNEVEYLMRGPVIHEVKPKLEYPGSLTVFKGKLFFTAEQPHLGRELWTLDLAHAASGSAELFMEAAPGSTGGYFSRIFLDKASNKLYLAASYYCRSVYTNLDTFFVSDGTKEGTRNLRDPPCPVPEKTVDDSEPESPPHGPSKPELLSLLFLSLLPMIGVALFVLLSKKMPGLWLNINYGIIATFVVVWVLIAGDSRLTTAFKCFLSVYTVVLKVLVAIIPLRAARLPTWTDELKTWIVVIVSFDYFVIAHLDLEIPITSSFLMWLLYALYAVEEVVFSIVTARTVPMVFGAASTFVIAFKISWESVEFFFGETWSREVRTMIMLTVLAGQGIGIIMGAIYYNGKRRQIEGRVYKLLSGRDLPAADGQDAVDDPEVS